MAKCHINNKGEYSQNKENEFSLEIDVLTPCLIEVATGKEVDTTYSEVLDKSELTNLQKTGWNFDWTKEYDDCDIYKITLSGDTEIQGLIAIKDDPNNSAVYARLAETAPHNFSKNKQYEGVGGHLMAIAVKKSDELGYDGFVYLDAKTKLIEHYKKTLKAKVNIGKRMYIDENAAQYILSKYTLMEG